MKKVCNQPHHINHTRQYDFLNIPFRVRYSPSILLYCQRKSEAAEAVFESIDSEGQLILQ